MENRCPPESFTVVDGAIVASGPASHAYYDGAFSQSPLPQLRVED